MWKILKRMCVYVCVWITCCIPKVEVAQSCLTLCDPMDYTVHRMLQARILEWVASPFSRDLPNPGIEPRSPTLQVDSLPAEPQRKPRVQYKYMQNGWLIPFLRKIRVWTWYKIQSLQAYQSYRKKIMSTIETKIKCHRMLLLTVFYHRMVFLKPFGCSFHFCWLVQLLIFKAI